MYWERRGALLSSVTWGVPCAARVEAQEADACRAQKLHPYHAGPLPEAELD
jgi:hypothetical protein